MAFYRDTYFPAVDNRNHVNGGVVKGTNRLIASQKKNKSVDLFSCLYQFCINIYRRLWAFKSNYTGMMTFLSRGLKLSGGGKNLDPLLE